MSKFFFELSGTDIVGIFQYATETVPLGLTEVTEANYKLARNDFGTNELTYVNDTVVVGSAINYQNGQSQNENTVSDVVALNDLLEAIAQVALAGALGNTPPAQAESDVITYIDRIV